MCACRHAACYIRVRVRRLCADACMYLNMQPDILGAGLGLGFTLGLGLGFVLRVRVRVRVRARVRVRCSCADACVHAVMQPAI